MIRPDTRPPADPYERAVLARFLKSASAEGAFQKAGTPTKPYAFGDGTPTWYKWISPGKKEYKYAQAVLFKPGCLIGCHSGSHDRIDDHQWRQADGGKCVKAKAGDLAGVVVVTLSLEQTNKAINRNRAILITAALVTAILAMVASYVIVRYVIVKPVKHLRDVTDAIAAGKLNIRSQIQTGDEFEELSHAFNRMLRNLVAMQQELREVNGDLDRKVDELAQANLALYEMNRLKSDFLATMSHELRTPLNSIIGFSEVLVRQRAARRTAAAVRGEHPDLGQDAAGDDQRHPRPGQDRERQDGGPRSRTSRIRDVCEGLADLVRPLAEQKNIDLECRLDEAIPLLRQDPGKLQQILNNLLSNAIKFTPEGGRVSLRADAEGRHVVIDGGRHRRSASPRRTAT